MLRKREKECEHFKDKKRMSGETLTSEGQHDDFSKMKSETRMDLHLPKASAKLTSHLLKTPFLSENLDKGDFVVEKTSQSKEDSETTVGPCGDSEQSASSRNPPSSSESSGKRTLSLKSRRRKTLSPNTFSNRRKLLTTETTATKEVVNSILIPDDEDQEIREENVCDTRDKSVDPVVQENSSEICCKSSNESKEIDKSKPSENESATELFTSSLEDCEQIKSKRRRGRKPRRYQRHSLPGPVMPPVVNSSESQASQELETLMIVQQSMGLCSDRGRRRTRQSRSHQPILLSSVFQFIIDDARRTQGEEDFVLPAHTFGDLIETKCLDKISSEDVSADDKKKIEDYAEDKLTAEKTIMNIVEEMPSSDFLHSIPSHDGKEKEREKEVNPFVNSGLSVEQNVEIHKSVLTAKHDIKVNSSPSDARNLKKGYNSNCQSISEPVSKDYCKEMFALKETQIAADFNGEVNVKSTSNADGTEDITCGSEVLDRSICPEDGQLDSELDISVGSDQQTESDDENFGDILKERMATQVSFMKVF
jgi:hypothetical protein